MSTEPLPRRAEVRRRSAAARSRRIVPAAVVVGLLVASALLFRALGGSWYIVQTPSMGATAPVGTLVLEQPVGPGGVRVGEIITFHPPTVPREVYTHRVVAVGPDGIATRGDINGAEDGWRLRPGDVVGRTVAILPGVGWLVRMLPAVVAGWTLVAVLTGFVRTPHRRAALRLVGANLVLSAVLAWLRPLLNVVLLTSVATPTGSSVQLVSTGILPVRIHAPAGRFLDLVAGQVGVLRVPATEIPGRYALTSSLALPFWGWAVLIAACCIPLAWSLLMRFPQDVRRSGARQGVGP